MTAVSVTNYKIDRDILKMEGDIGMYMSKVFRETWAEGEAKGREEGRAEGIIETGEGFGLSKDAIIERLQKIWIYRSRRHRDTMKDSKKSVH